MTMDPYIRSDDGAVMVAVGSHNYVSVSCLQNPKSKFPRCRSPEACMALGKCGGAELVTEPGSES